MKLAGRRILIVEDEALIALGIEDMLGDLGCEVIGIAPCVGRALQMIDADAAGIDAVTLDINLNETNSREVATVLRDRGIPCIVCTGYADPTHLEGFEHNPVLNKPFERDDLERVLRSLTFRT
jgi:CheY-like chemotaxis protein